MSVRACLLAAWPFVLTLAACASDPAASHTSPGGAGQAGAGVAGQVGAAGAPGGAGAPGAGVGGASPGSAGADASAGSSNGGLGGSAGLSGGSAGAPPSAGAGGSNIPAGYTGAPFKVLTIPGFIYAADYDKGGSGVAFCRVGAASPPTAATCGVANLNDWCCGNQKGCNQRAMPDKCPIYRTDAENAGLSHLNAPEPDNYAVSGPTWVAGPNGPTLTGPNAVVKTPLPYHANTTTADDTYISYMYTGQWEQYTVQVMSAGTYSIGGLVAAPGGTTIRFDFGGTVTSGIINVPASPTPETEAYHEWNIVSSMGTVTFPAAGTYLMRFTLVAQQFNPLYFTFTKM